VFTEGHSQVACGSRGRPRCLCVPRKSFIAEMSADRTVLGYLELIFASTAMSPTASVPFTALDLGVLRVVLSSRRK